MYIHWAPVCSQFLTKNTQVVILLARRQILIDIQYRLEIDIKVRFFKLRR